MLEYCIVLYCIWYSWFFLQQINLLCTIFPSLSLSWTYYSWRKWIRYLRMAIFFKKNGLFTSWFGHFWNQLCKHGFHSSTFSLIPIFLFLPDYFSFILLLGLDTIFIIHLFTLVVTKWNFSCCKEREEKEFGKMNSAFLLFCSNNWMETSVTGRRELLKFCRYCRKRSWRREKRKNLMKEK